MGKTVRNIAFGVAAAVATVATAGIALVAGASLFAAAAAAASVALVGAQYLMRPTSGAAAGANLPMPTASVVGPPPTPLRKTVRQSDIPRCFVFGRTKTAGAYFFYETDTNQNLYQGIYLCDGPVDGFDGVFCDDEAFGCGSTGYLRSCYSTDGNANVFIPTDGMKFIKAPYNPGTAGYWTYEYNIVTKQYQWVWHDGTAATTDTIIACSCIAFEPVNGTTSGYSSYIFNTLMKSALYSLDADSVTTGHQSNMANTWTTSHLGKGITCLYTFASTYKTTNAARLKYFPNGWPEWAVAMRGARMYDPRKDSSNGGSGSHRYLSDGTLGPATSTNWTIYNTTWEWSENPAIVAAHFISWLINQKLTAITGIDWPSIIQAANDCDEPRYVQKLNYGNCYEPFARITAVYYFNTPPREFLSNLMAACDGSYSIDQNGKFTMWIGKWEAPQVTFTENDIGGFTEEFVESATEAVNELHITYTEPRQNYQRFEAPTYRDTSSQALVGKKISTINFDMVPTPSQAYRLGQRFAKRINGKRKLNVTLGPRGMLAIKQRVVDISAPNFGITSTTGVAWRVESLVPELGLAKWSATLREITTDVFSDAVPSDPLGNLSIVSQKAITAPQIITLTSQRVSGTTSSVIATIDTNLNNPTVAASTINEVALMQEQTLTAFFQYSLNGGSTWLNFTNVVSGYSSIASGITAGTTVTVRAQFLALNGSSSSWSPTASITAA